jgi:tRNA (guanine37-N1)-methyltransferase
MKRAIDKGLVEVHFHNLRIIPRTNKSVDDYQYGGAGMVMTVQPIDACITIEKRKNLRRNYLYVARRKLEPKKWLTACRCMNIIIL